MRTYAELIGYLGGILDTVKVLSLGFRALVVHVWLLPWIHTGTLLVRTTSHALFDDISPPTSMPALSFLPRGSFFLVQTLEYYQPITRHSNEK